MTRLIPRATSIAVAMLLCVANVSAADLGHPQDTGTVEESISNRLVVRALTYELRSAFNVMTAEEIVHQLDEDARRLKGGAVSAAEEEVARRDLLEEGSYYLVSLSYLIDAGGPAWPSDKSEAVYAADALARLRDLRYQWVGAVDGDLSLALSILRSADVVNAQTEGETAATGDLDHFGNTESLVQSALAQSN